MSEWGMPFAVGLRNLASLRGICSGVTDSKLQRVTESSLILDTPYWNTADIIVGFFGGLNRHSLRLHESNHSDMKK